MSNLSVEGKIKRIHDEQVISDRFKKREFVIETEEQYPQFLMFQLVQDKTNLVDAVKAGDKVEVFFNLRGREWQKDPSSEIKVFNTLDAWRIQKVEAMQAEAMPSAEPVAPAAPEDDLPF
ncbi:MAG: DUF3127 domain-containing protein [Flavobacteriales bacterium]|jgi:hypothetical protein|tara:strand:- start:165 stop:524 length:360 start_codon:yes stop_codon:yes gene_type:complete